jgi:hypothetical protein
VRSTYEIDETVLACAKIIIPFFLLSIIAKKQLPINDQHVEATSSRISQPCLHLSLPQDGPINFYSYSLSKLSTTKAKASSILHYFETDLCAMAEALGLIASITAVCEAAGTIVQYLNDVRSASEDTKQVRTELRNLCGILHSIRDLAKDLPDFSTLFPGFNALLGKEGALEQFKDVLEDLTLRLGIGQRGVRHAASLITWPLRKNGTNEMVASLERYKTIFVLALTNDHS